MSDGSLSQDEIDALLQGGDIGSASTPSAGGSSAGLSRQEISEFAAIISELLPSQAQNLSNMVGDRITSYNVCYTKLLRTDNSGKLGDLLTA